MQLRARKGAIWVAWLAAASTLTCRPSSDEPESTASSYRQARHIIDRAIQAMGSAEAIAEAGGLLFHASGERDQSAEHQGLRPGSASRVRFEEHIAVDVEGGRVAHEYRQDRIDGTSEWVREIFDLPDRRLIVVLEDGFAVPLHSEEHREHRRRISRRIPQLLMSELLENASSLRSLGSQRVVASLSSGETLTLDFDPESGVLLRVDYLMDAPTLGDVVVAWTFGDYRPVERLGLFAREYAVTIGDSEFMRMAVDEVEFGGDAERFLSLPPDIELPDPINLPRDADPSRNARVIELHPGIYRVEGLRAGFHGLFLELDESILAVDAPAGYPLMTELPASDVAPGPTTDWLSRRYLELIRESVPDKPIRHVVLTHFHNDHAGGLRAFIAEGATVIASATAREAVEAFASAEHTIAPDRLSTAPRELSLETVSGVTVIEDSSRRVEILEIGENPHAADLLAVYLPRERVLFASDLLTPVPVDRFPLPSHERLDRFLAGWVVERGLDVDTILGSHGTGVAGPEHLERLRGHVGS